MSNSNLASIKQLLNLLNCHINFKLTNSHRTLSSWSLSITNSLQFTKPSGLSQKPFNRWSKIPTQPNIKILNQFHFSSRCHNIIFVGKKFGWLLFCLFFFQNVYVLCLYVMVVSVSCFLLLFFKLLSRILLCFFDWQVIVNKMEEISLCETNSRHLHLWKSLYQMLRYNKMKAGFHFGGTKPAAAFKRASGWRRTRSRRTAGDCCKVPCFGSFYVLLLDRERTRFLKKQVRKKFRWNMTGEYIPNTANP